jgi:hypothetical protein
MITDSGAERVQKLHVHPSLVGVPHYTQWIVVINPRFSGLEQIAMSVGQSKAHM